MEIDFNVERFRASLLESSEFTPAQVDALCDAFAEAFAGHTIRFHSAIGAATRPPRPPLDEGRLE